MTHEAVSMSNDIYFRYSSALVLKAMTMYHTVQALCYEKQLNLFN